MRAEKEAYILKRGVFEATLKCNLNCKHCGSKAGKARDNELSVDEIRTLFKDLKSLGMEWISIAGGEPMTRDDWPQIIEAARDAGIKSGMITNATLLDLKAAKLAKEKGLSGIGLSLDGGDGATHDFIRGRVGHFKQLMDAMDVCNSIGLPFAVLTTLNTLNKDQLVLIHDIIEKKGAYSWQLQIGTDMGNLLENKELQLSPEHLIDIEATIGKLIKLHRVKIHPSDSIGYFGSNEKVLRRYTNKSHWKGCGAGKSVIGIESNGNIKGCLSIMPGYNENSDKYVEGN
ncbi:MAG: radical SAM protein, partial [Deltaproteobacteria bacterium]|nr:radical SAM protein [Deltaproteobacteria bacterium]